MEITPLWKARRAWKYREGESTRTYLPAVSGVRLEALFKNMDKFQTRRVRTRHSENSFVQCTHESRYTLTPERLHWGKGWPARHRGEDGAGCDVSHECATREEQVGCLQRGDSLNVAGGLVLCLHVKGWKHRSSMY